MADWLVIWLLYSAQHIQYMYVRLMSASEVSSGAVVAAAAGCLTMHLLSS